MSGEVELRYLGGRLPTDEFAYGSLMMTDLIIGNEYVLVLRKIGEQFYLERGYEDILRPTSTETYRHPRSRISLTSAEIAGVCP